MGELLSDGGIRYFISMAIKHKEVLPVKLFCGILVAPPMTLSQVIRELESRFGTVDGVSRELDFLKYSSYYVSEMGPVISRYFVSFDRLVDRTLLPDIKHQTHELETLFLEGGLRRVNLDPGYMALGQIFLASTKDNFFRIYLRDHIYAEVTLYYKQGTFHGFPWTYPDYASGEYFEFFGEMRKRLKSSMDEMKG